MIFEEEAREEGEVNIGFSLLKSCEVAKLIYERFVFGFDREMLRVEVIVDVF